jgi:hypothetical protein
VIRRANASLCCLLLAACAPLPTRDTAPIQPNGQQPAAALVAVPATPPAAAPLATPADLAARDMLAFHDRVRQLSPQDIAKELAHLNDEPPNPRATLQLALLLGQTRSNGDIARALSLLDPLLRSTAPDAVPWQPLARLISARYAEQRRLEEQFDRQNQQARDSQRKIEQLNEKLEALKAIERSLTTRPAASTAPPAASAPAPRGTQP